jgi:hypothetical protein
MSSTSFCELHEKVSYTVIGRWRSGAGTGTGTGTGIVEGDESL